MPRILHHEIDKSVADLTEHFCSIMADDKIDKAAAMTKLFKQYGDYLKSLPPRDMSGLGDDEGDQGPIVDPLDTPTALHPNLHSIVQAMITAEPTLTQQTALYHLLNRTAFGDAMARTHNSLTKKGTTMPQIDIMKVISIVENGLLVE
jgi:hypothetical protein